LGDIIVGSLAADPAANLEYGEAREMKVAMRKLTAGKISVDGKMEGARRFTRIGWKGGRTTAA
jgi:phage FluMu protein gp41